MIGFRMSSTASVGTNCIPHVVPIVTDDVTDSEYAYPVLANTASPILRKATLCVKFIVLEPKQEYLILATNKLNNIHQTKRREVCISFSCCNSDVSSSL